jgi:hypothetical protein
LEAVAAGLAIVQPAVNALAAPHLSTADYHEANDRYLLFPKTVQGDNDTAAKDAGNAVYAALNISPSYYSAQNITSLKAFNDPEIVVGGVLGALL